MSATSKRSSSGSGRAAADGTTEAFARRVAASLAKPLPPAGALETAVATVRRGASLSVEQAVEAVRLLMTGAVSPEAIAALLVGLHQKGETVEEIAAFAAVMRAAAAPVRPRVRGLLADTCGTGGDLAKTFNVSTAAAFIVAAAGVPVAKHGNRALTSTSGSADVLEALGARIELEPSAVERCIERVGIGFLFAPRFHQATKHVQPVRRQLPHKTIFNLLGPLTNPAPVTAQLVGVYDAGVVDVMAEALRLLGRARALVVHGRAASGAGGMDECSLSGETIAAFVDEAAAIRRLSLEPEAVGLPRVGLEALSGGDAVVNARLIERIVRGEERGPRRALVIFNGAAALWAAGAVPDLAAGVARATELIDNGAVHQKLQRFIRATQEESGHMPHAT